VSRGAAAAFALALASGLGGARAGTLPPERAPALPRFTQTAPAQWLNSAPLTVEQLHGSVVLLDFWTFACWNCYRSIPWLKGLERRYAARGLRVVGVHTPELPKERVRANVIAKVAEFGIAHPVMLDDDFAYWNALGNQYWPAFYLVDRQGRVRAMFVGETHAGDAQAARIEAEVEALLAEAPR
jgi:thiol-disulfide isomerase/thioredoxin